MSDDILACGELEVSSPIDGRVIAHLDIDTTDSVTTKIVMAHKAYQSWRLLAAPRRG